MPSRRSWRADYHWRAAGRAHCAAEAAGQTIGPESRGKHLLEAFALWLEAELAAEGKFGADAIVIEETA